LSAHNDPGRIVTEQLLGERRVVRPAMCAAASNEQFRQLAGCFVAQGNKINGLAPGGRLLCATGSHHLADDSREQSGRVLPADQVKALELLADEIERVPSVGERSLSFGREQGIGQYTLRGTGRNCRE
jgi:hypothetical protein